MNYKIEWFVTELRSSCIKLSVIKDPSPADLLAAYYRLETVTHTDIGKCGYRLRLEKIEKE